MSFNLPCNFYVKKKKTENNWEFFEGEKKMFEAQSRSKKFRKIFDR